MADYVTLSTAEGQRNIPIFNRSDWEWSTEGGGGWLMSEAARQRMSPYMDLFTGPSTNYAWNPYYQGGEMKGGTVNPLEMTNTWMDDWIEQNGDSTINHGGAGWRGDYSQDVNPIDILKSLHIKDSRSTQQGFRYEKVGDQLVPVMGERGNWITNGGEMNRKALVSFASLIAAGIAIPAAAAAVGIEAGAIPAALSEGVAAGTIPEAVAFESGFIPSAAGAVGGETATAAGAAAAAAGEVVMPAVTITAPAAGGGLTAAEIAAGVGAAGTGASMLGEYAPGEAPGSIDERMGGQDWMKLVEQYGPKVLEFLGGNGGAGSIFNAIGAGINASADEKYTDRLLANRTENAQKLFDYGQQFKGAYDPRGATVDNGISTSTIDPATGRATTRLNAPFQQAQDQYLGAANTMFGQLKDFNPQTFAKDRYDSAQNLLAAGDTQAEQGLMQELYNKGGYGLQLNTPSAAMPGTTPGTVQAGQGTTPVNPYLSTLLNSRNERNANMSYKALNEGESYLDRLIGRQKGMFDAGMGIAREGAGSLTPAMNLSSNLTSDYRKAAEWQYGLGKDYYGEIGSANRDAMYADALRRSGMISGAFNMPTSGGGGGGGSWASALPGIISTVAGWFGGSTPPVRR